MIRKKCSECKKPLISFEGNNEGKPIILYLHPDTPCSGITDAIHIEGIIQDTEVQKKWIETYGVPELSDYELLNKIEANPLGKILLYLIKKRK